MGSTGCFRHGARRCGWIGVDQGCIVTTADSSSQGGILRDPVVGNCIFRHAKNNTQYDPSPFVTSSRNKHTTICYYGICLRRKTPIWIYVSRATLASTYATQSGQVVTYPNSPSNTKWWPGFAGIKNLLEHDKVSHSVQPASQQSSQHAMPVSSGSPDPVHPSLKHEMASELLSSSVSPELLSSSVSSVSSSRLPSSRLPSSRLPSSRFPSSRFPSSRFPSSRLTGLGGLSLTPVAVLVARRRSQMSGSSSTSHMEVATIVWEVGLS